MRRHGDLEAAVGGAAVCALLALALPFDLLRVLVGAPLLFFLPGYAITAAIFAHGRIPRSQFLVFSLGLSLAVLALGALVLNYLPGGVRAGWWAVLLFLVVLGACRGAALRRPKRAPAPIAWTAPRVNGAQAGLLAGGALLVIAAVVLAFVPLSATNALGYTELSIRPLEAGAGPGVRVAVGSGERDDSSYRLVVKFGDGEGEASSRIALAPGQTQVLELEPPDNSPAAMSGAVAIPVTATLFKEDSPEPGRPFRQVTTVIPPGEGSG
ncbi:MAG TPA: DUF1616 domain-containing protein [Solirubrobacterales bacterium]|nr:DUF1616 domain-containing protein [Solirubrobacterales bacterium]